MNRNHNLIIMEDCSLKKDISNDFNNTLPSVNNHSNNNPKPQAASMICMVPPSPSFYAFTLIHREVQRLLQLVLSGNYSQQTLVETLSRFNDTLQQQIVFKVILIILLKYSREDKLHTFDEDIIFHLLTIVPSAAKMKDSDGLLLIHHFSVMEDPSEFIIKKLIDCYPASSTEYALFGYVEATPLHLMLLKNSPNFELASYIVDSYPACVKCDTIDGKLPIHLFADIPWSGSSYRMEFLEKLLKFYPKGLFIEITEEVHFLSPVVEETSEIDNNYDHEPLAPRQSNNEDDGFAGVHVLIGQDHFKMERQILTWSPLKKLRENDQMEINLLLDTTVANLTRAHFEQQWNHNRASRSGFSSPMF